MKIRRNEARSKAHDRRGVIEQIEKLALLRGLYREDIYERNESVLHGDCLYNFCLLALSSARLRTLSSN